MKKKIIVIILLLLIISGMTGGYYFYNETVNQGHHSSKQVIVEVEQGETPKNLLNIMYKKGLVKNIMMGSLYLRLTNPKIKANTYAFNTSMSLKDMFKEMGNDKSSYIMNSKLIIQEGLTIPAIAKKVAKLLNMNEKTILKTWNDQNYLKTLAKDYWFLDMKTLSNKNLLYPLEGYLYPDTYFINDKKPTLDLVTRKLLDMTNKKITPYKNKMTGMSVHQYLTLASIVEKESLYDEDISKIAGVFMNRLNQGMRLESDITVNYALQRTGVKVTHKMLQTKSPYNTYLYKGLPVGPVSSVQIKTLDRTIHYAKHDNYYFFAKKDGQVIYSKTYKQHLEAVEKYKWY
ncbi:endolytic transglycosylase MltG [Eggerthia catenaformis]